VFLPRSWASRLERTDMIFEAYCRPLRGTNGMHPHMSLSLADRSRRRQTQKATSDGEEDLPRAKDNTRRRVPCRSSRRRRNHDLFSQSSTSIGRSLTCVLPRRAFLSADYWLFGCFPLSCEASAIPRQIFRAFYSSRKAYMHDTLC